VQNKECVVLPVV